MSSIEQQVENVEEHVRKELINIEVKVEDTKKDMNLKAQIEGYEEAKRSIVIQ